MRAPSIKNMNSSRCLGSEILNFEVLESKENVIMMNDESEICFFDTRNMGKKIFSSKLNKQIGKVSILAGDESKILFDVGSDIIISEIELITKEEELFDRVC